MLMLTGCLKHSYEYEPPKPTDEEIIANTESVFGVKFSEEHEWNAIHAMTATFIADADLDDIVKIQVLTKSPFGNGDSNGSTVLTESEATKGESVTLTFDVHEGYTRLYAACVSSSGDYYVRGFDVTEETAEVSFSKARTRLLDPAIAAKVSELPENPVLSSEIVSYETQRGYEGYQDEKLYAMSDADEYAQMLCLDEFDYKEGLKADLQDIIFTYLPNKVSNIEKIRESSFYNKLSYPITTGEDPIIVDPVYKDDGGYHEVEKCQLFYYYFKEDDIKNMSEEEEVAYYKSLPKFKAFSVSKAVEAGGVSLGMPDKKLRKNLGFVIIFWGECKKGNMPGIGSVGSYLFPSGYKIGFMLRNAGKTVHQGELYCDGRMNNEVQSWGHLASSKLEPGDARLTWLYANKKNFLCCEAGTDRDFNDLVLEVEGGIEPIGDNPPNPKYNAYMMCFEDSPVGDYDMNDVVIKAERIDKTRVRYTLMACGAYDELYLRNINGKILNESKEVHSYFNALPRTFVNTLGTMDYGTVVDVVTVPEKFTFTDISKQVFIHDATTDIDIKLAQKGQSPHGIMIPYDFKWPIERICIKDAYLEFNSWGQSFYVNETTTWYERPVDELVMPR